MIVLMGTYYRIPLTYIVFTISNTISIPYGTLYRDKLLRDIKRKK